jgi:hypothetical protein
MMSSIVTRTSAVLQLIGGAGLLFTPDVILGALAPAMPASTLWIGQLLAAAWMGMAALNWLQRATVIGGIYGRPIVCANFVLFFVSAMSMTRVVRSPPVPWGAWLLAGVFFAMAAVYAALLFRGPFDALPTRE